MHSSYYRSLKKVSTSLAQEDLNDPVSLVCPTIAPPSFPCHPGSSIHKDCQLESLSTYVRRETGKESTNGSRCTYVFARHSATIADWSGVGRVTIDMLPDVVLLKIFDCYVNQARELADVEGTNWFDTQAWHTLVHVCRKWRTIILDSPRFPDLRLLCTEKTRVEETLAVWPPLPIVIRQYGYSKRMGNIIVALEHNDRVCQIDLSQALTESQMEEVLAAMQQPFPALTDLKFGWNEQWLLADETPPVVPDSFLGGSAPHLQHLLLECIPFPGLPNLLLSATGLVSLHIWKIPHSGYISPEAMVHCLSTLTRLERLSLGFESPPSRPIRESRRPHPPTRSALPALTYLRFEGVSEYLEDLVARIDVPLLEGLEIMFFHQLIFDTPQLVQFLARSPNIRPPVEARIVFSDRYVEVTFPQTLFRSFTLGTSCRQSDWQLSSLAQLCSSSFPEAFVPMVERLYISEYGDDRPRWKDDIEDSQWLEVLHPFTGLKDLHISREFLLRIAPAFQEIAGERVTEVLPALQSLFLEELHPPGPVQEAIENFVAARQLASHPIAVSHWGEKQDGGLEGDD
jgi:hypothetical protein